MCVCFCVCACCHRFPTTTREYAIRETCWEILTLAEHYTHTPPTIRPQPSRPLCSLQPVCRCCVSALSTFAKRISNIGAGICYTYGYFHVKPDEQIPHQFIQVSTLNMLLLDANQNAFTFYFSFRIFFLNFFKRTLFLI